MDAWIGPAVTATIISSLIAVIGWFVAYGSARTMERIRRREKIRDFQVALLAEIRSEAFHLGHWDFDADIHAVEQAYSEAQSRDRVYYPLVPRPAGSLVRESLLPEIHLLPEETIDPVMLYYRQMQLVERFVEDLRGEGFRTLEPARQIKMYRDYIEMMRFWRTLADDAATALRRSLARNAPVSSAAWGHSARKSASASASRRSSRNPPSA